jgi:hypothetical protein
MKTKATLAVLALTASMLVAARQSTPTVSGDYLEVRSCDIYTGPCFANAEMGLAGKEAILVWSVRNGAWDGVKLNDLKVIAVVRTDDTLGDLRYQPRSGKAVLVVDSKATTDQQEALARMAKSLAGALIKEVISVKTSAIDATLGSCSKAGCASVKADGLLEVATRCLGGKDHLCGNEEVYYPPLTSVKDPLPAYTELASYQGDGLNVTWQSTGQRSAFLASFGQ